ncbi:hypothetical protein [Niveispirillum fermenti]|uniref:hypothetical protein n=1 Tax=Niveispirillum fermenti TaxID=1233113 RepID=UPI003A86E8EA
MNIYVLSGAAMTAPHRRIPKNSTPPGMSLRHAGFGKLACCRAAIAQAQAL